MRRKTIFHRTLSFRARMPFILQHISQLVILIAKIIINIQALNTRHKIEERSGREISLNLSVPYKNAIYTTAYRATCDIHYKNHSRYSKYKYTSHKMNKWEGRQFFIEPYRSAQECHLYYDISRNLYYPL